MSDDGPLEKVDVFLDGNINEDGRARAGFQPEGVTNDVENHVVRTEEFTGPSEIVFLFAAAIVIVLVICYFHYLWSD